MRRELNGYFLAVAVVVSLLFCSATTSAQNPNADKKTKDPKRGRYVNPEKIKPEDANPEIKSEKDLWKLKYLHLNYKRLNPNSEKIFSVLDQDTEFDFAETPLTDVVDYLGDLHNIEFAIDARALADAGIATDTALSRRLSGITLKSGLRLLLSEIKLDFVVENEVLLITTAEQAASKLETHVYETRLLKTIPPDKLAEILVATISRESWRDAEGKGFVKPLPGCLIVYQTQKVHEEIVDLLMQLLNHSDNPLFRESSQPKPATEK